MSAEREQMRVKLTNLRYQERRLGDKITELCGTIRANLNTFNHSVKDLHVVEAASQMDDLVSAYGELQGVLGEISRLEAELDG